MRITNTSKRFRVATAKTLKQAIKAADARSQHTANYLKQQNMKKT